MADKNIVTEFTHEDGEYYYGRVDPGMVEGVECNTCGLIFAVLATVDIKLAQLKPIPLSGTVPYYCPCCGTNLQEQIRASLPPVDPKHH